MCPEGVASCGPPRTPARVPRFGQLGRGGPGYEECDQALTHMDVAAVALRTPLRVRSPRGTDSHGASMQTQQQASFRRARERCAVGYARRSTDKQEQSIPDQQRAIERYCEENGLSLSKWFIDDAISGTKATNRPAFQEMVKSAGSQSCEFGLIVVYDVKRFGRLDNDEAGFYRHTLRQHGVEVLYVAEGFAAFGESSDTDDLLRPVKQWQARQESKDLSKVTIRGQLSKVRTGCWMGGVAPHGYDLRYTNDRGEFLFRVRFMPDGTKQQLDDRGGVGGVGVVGGGGRAGHSCARSNAARRSTSPSATGGTSC